MTCDLDKPREDCPYWKEGLCGCGPTPTVSYVQVREYLDWLDEQVLELTRQINVFGESSLIGISVRTERSSLQLARARFLNIMAIKSVANEE